MLLKLPTGLEMSSFVRAIRLYSTQKYLQGVQNLESTVENGVLYIRFNRPQKRNAINTEMYHGFISTLKKSVADSEVKVTVVTGAEDYYSSGNDFSPAEFGRGDMEERIKEACSTVQQFVASFIDYPKLLIAVVNGPAIGIAASTVALCDVIFASDKAWFRTPFSQLGLIPEGCSSITFPRILGPAKASGLLYLNETLTASEALACGFVTRIFPHSQLIDETRKCAQEYARLPLQSLMLSKELVRRWDKELLHKVNREECKVLGDRFLSEDFVNALMAFSQKKSKL